MRLFVLSVMVLFMLQPALIAYAQSETGEQPASQPSDESTEAPVEHTRDTEIASPDNSDIASDESEESTESPDADSTTEQPTESDTDSESTSDTTAATEEPAAPPPVNETATTTAGATSTQPAASSTATTTTESTVPTAAKTNTSDSTEESAVVDEPAPLRTVVTSNSSYYQFSREKCVQVGDGSYYCAEKSKPKPQADSFYVALDTDGDKEIFATLDGETYQVTNNRVDDAAPYYDPLSETLVWHRQIDGRYQIMSYDFDTETETQITNDRTNSMQPVRSGDITAWQHWHEGSWDIVYTDGSDELVLGMDEVPDIAPQVNQQYITWSRVHEGEQQVVVYDIEAEAEVTLPAGEPGSSVRSARMMLVLEGVTREGDTIVRGYDPVTKEIVPLTNQPAPLPENIPDSEPTSEVRALVQQKSSDEELAESTEDLPPAEPTATSTVPTSTTAKDTLVIPPAATSSVDTTPEDTTPEDITAVAVATSTEQAQKEEAFTLVIPPQSTTTEQ